LTSVFSWIIFLWSPGVSLSAILNIFKIYTVVNDTGGHIFPEIYIDNGDTKLAPTSDWQWQEQLYQI
jgi:hypothetical protein